MKITLEGKQIESLKNVIDYLYEEKEHYQECLEEFNGNVFNHIYLDVIELEKCLKQSNYISERFLKNE